MIQQGIESQGVLDVDRSSDVVIAGFKLSHFQFNTVFILVAQMEHLLRNSWFADCAQISFLVSWSSAQVRKLWLNGF